MNPGIKKIFQKIFVNDISYKILSPLLYLSGRLKASRENYLQASDEEKLRVEADKIFADKFVRHGPFKGMLFSTAYSPASSTYAKLLGSYESEIHPFISALLQKKHELVVNIGCDDGYYALGLAKANPATRVLAYDSNKAAVTMASGLAHQNNLEQRITFGGTFRADDISEMEDGLNALFIVDCEGAERQIFTAENVSKLKQADLVIELHLHLYPDLEDYLRNIFSATHEVEIVNSIDDHIKAREYHYPEIEGLSYQLRKYITQERDIFMQWMLLTAKETRS